MALIIWSEDMKVGVPEIDFEHEQLIGVINALGERLLKGEPPEAIQALLGDIHAQIEAHFALEEKIMRETKFVGYAAHKEDHDSLLEQIRDIMVEVSSMDEGVLHSQLAKRLSLWFSEHFRTLDRSFHSFGNAPSI